MTKKITFAAAALVRVTKLLNKIASRDGVLPILQCVLVYPATDKGVYFMAFDMENYLTLLVNIPNDIDAFCIDSTLFSKVIENNAGKDVELSVDYDAMRCMLSTDTGSSTIPILDAEEFPVPMNIEGEHCYIDPANSFADYLVLASKFTANDELRPVLSGVSVDGERVAATNANYLIKIPYVLPSLNPSIISVKTVGILKEFVDYVNDSQMVWTMGDSGVCLSHGGSSVVFRVIDGTYPKVDSVIPDSHKFRFLLNKNALLSAIKKVSVFSSKLTSLIKLSFEPGKLTVEAQDVDLSAKGEECIYDDGIVGNVVIGLKADYFKQCLMHVKGDSVLMLIESPSRAVVLKGEGANTILLMPMLINN